MQAICIVYMCTVVRLVFEGDPIGYYECGQRHSRRGEEDDQSSAKDDASGQHPSVIIYARHLGLEGRPRTRDLRKSQETWNSALEDSNFAVIGGRGSNAWSSGRYLQGTGPSSSPSRAPALRLPGGDGLEASCRTEHGRVEAIGSLRL
jgi:hypothetical protein